MIRTDCKTVAQSKIEGFYIAQAKDKSEAAATALVNQVYIYPLKVRLLSLHLAL